MNEPEFRPRGVALLETRGFLAGVGTGMIGRPRNTAAVVRKCLVCAGGKTTCQDVLLASKICDALQSEMDCNRERRQCPNA